MENLFAYQVVDGQAQLLAVGTEHHLQALIATLNLFGFDRVDADKLIEHNIKT